MASAFNEMLAISAADTVRRCHEHMKPWPVRALQPKKKCATENKMKNQIKTAASNCSRRENLVRDSLYRRRACTPADWMSAM